MDRKSQASLLRKARKLHRSTGALLFLLFMLVSITALLLGWKKNSQGWLLPETMEGPRVAAAQWIPLHELEIKAAQALEDAVEGSPAGIDRIDIRPDKGVAKVLFLHGYWEVQLALADGRVLQIAQRRSDFVEDLHDGSIFDVLLQTKGDIIKLIYTSVLGLALLLFTITGFWLWYGPKVLRRSGSKHT